MQPNATNPASSMKDESQLVTFLLKDEEFGFDIMSVQEIIRTPKMAKVPRTPPYVDGVANLRGVVLPIIDMRARFGMERAEETDRTRVLVIDINGTKTGLRVDRVKQVTRVSRGEVERPPAAIRNTSTDYLEGVVKLDNGQRIIMALNAARVCHTEMDRELNREDAGAETASAEGRSAEPANGESGAHDAQQMVSFRIAREEYAFPMERVREILRVQTPKQIPDSPDYVLGVLTVRGQILPIIDLRRLLQQVSLAEEHCARCREVREDYSGWVERLEKRAASNTAAHLDLSATERLRNWITQFSSSNQVLMETLSDIRGRNDKVVKLAQASNHAEGQDTRHALDEAGAEVVELLCRLEQEITANIQEDQRIVVVDANGFLLGLVVDHVNEVLNIPRSSIDPPPSLAGSDGLELSGIAKLDEGNRLILLLDVGRLMHEQNLRQLKNGGNAERSEAGSEGRRGSQAHEELQLVTFMLGVEEYGVPISQIQEIDRVSRITKVPKVARYVEGVANLRGEVIPVIDSRRRFDLGAKESDDRTRVIIVDLSGVKTGLIVDSVREVLSIARRDIAPPPAAISSGIGRQFISGIGKVDGGSRMIVLLDVEKILVEETRL